MRCLSLIVILLCLGYVPTTHAQSLKGKQAPPLELPNVAHPGTFKLSTYVGKKATSLRAAMVVYFFSLQCKRCVRDMPRMLRGLRRQQYGNMGVGVVLVATGKGQTLQQLQQFIKKNKINVPVLADFSGKSAAAWNVKALPGQFIIQPSGLVKFALRANFPATYLRRVTRSILWAGLRKVRAWRKKRIATKNPATMQAQLTRTQKKQSYSSVYVDSVPSGAWVKFDGINQGQTPIRIQKVTSGERTIAVLKKGFLPTLQNVRLKPGDVVSLTVRLTRKDRKHGADFYFPYQDKSIGLVGTGRGVGPGKTISIGVRPKPRKRAKAKTRPKKKNPSVVKVFYGTDRRPSKMPTFGSHFLVSLLGAGFGLLFFLLAWSIRYKVLWVVLGLFSCLFALFSWHDANMSYMKLKKWHSVQDPNMRVYGGERNAKLAGDSLEVGICEVSIPPNHKVGRIESVSITSMEFQEDPKKHIVLRKVKTWKPNRFYSELGKKIKSSPKKSAFLFIHGYNVTFEDAVKRAAQVSFDLDFKGATVAYSWPSKGALSGYTQDEASVLWSVSNFERFLRNIIQTTGIKTFHILAHSMGNRLLVHTMIRMSLKPPVQNNKPFKFKHIVMAAPDVDAQQFQSNYASHIKNAANRVTIYTSAHDRALVASKKLHKEPRLGLSSESGQPPVFIKTAGIEMIDASAVDTDFLGHSYFGDHTVLLSDLRAIVELGKPAGARERRFLWSMKNNIQNKLKRLFWKLKKKVNPGLRGAAIVSSGRRVGKSFVDPLASKESPSSKEAKLRRQVWELKAKVELLKKMLSTLKRQHSSSTKPSARPSQR